jgi:hypothetical protein
VTYYAEGDWFAVPLRGGGFGVGLAARAQPKQHGVVLGYFFGPVFAEPPSITELVGLTAATATLVQKFGDLRLIDGTWPVIGRVDRWERDHWPMPPFQRYEELTGRTMRVICDDDDANVVVSELQVSADEDEGLPSDGMLGAGAVEIVLTAASRS